MKKKKKTRKLRLKEVNDFLNIKEQSWKVQLDTIHDRDSCTCKANILHIKILLGKKHFQIMAMMNYIIIGKYLWTPEQI